MGGFIEDNYQIQLKGDGIFTDYVLPIGKSIIKNVIPGLITSIPETIKQTKEERRKKEFIEELSNIEDLEERDRYLRALGLTRDELLDLYKKETNPFKRSQILNFLSGNKTNPPVEVSTGSSPFDLPENIKPKKKIIKLN